MNMTFHVFLMKLQFTNYIPNVEKHSIKENTFNILGSERETYCSKLNKSLKFRYIRIEK